MAASGLTPYNLARVKNEIYRELVCILFFSVLVFMSVFKEILISVNMSLLNYNIGTNV